MAFNPNFESEYTKTLAAAIRMGASSSVLQNYCERIRKALTEIEDPEIRSQAYSRLDRIGTRGGILIEDPEGSRNSIAEEILRFADFLAKIK